MSAAAGILGSRPGSPSMGLDDLSPEEMKSPISLSPESVSHSPLLPARSPLLPSQDSPPSIEEEGSVCASREIIDLRQVIANQNVNYQRVANASGVAMVATVGISYLVHVSTALSVAAIAAVAWPILAVLGLVFVAALTMLAINYFTNRHVEQVQSAPVDAPQSEPAVSPPTSPSSRLTVTPPLSPSNSDSPVGVDASAAEPETLEDLKRQRSEVYGVLIESLTAMIRVLEERSSGVSNPNSAMIVAEAVKQLNGSVVELSVINTSITSQCAADMAPEHLVQQVALLTQRFRSLKAKGPSSQPALSRPLLTRSLSEVRARAESAPLLHLLRPKPLRAPAVVQAQDPISSGGIIASATSKVWSLFDRVNRAARNVATLVMGESAEAPEARELRKRVADSSV